jgi:acetyl esterase/lipase
VTEVRQVSINAKSFGGDLSKGFLTGGASGGGNATCMAAIKAKDKHLQPPLTGHLLVCTGMPHSHEDAKGNILNLFPEQLTRGSWEKYKDGPVATRAMNTLYASEFKLAVPP